MPTENPFRLHPFPSHKRAEYFNIGYSHQWGNGNVFRKLENILLGGEELLNDTNMGIMLMKTKWGSGVLIL